MMDMMKTSDRLYKVKEGRINYFSPATTTFIPDKFDLEEIHIAVLKAKNRVIMENLSATLIDMGDEVLLF